MEFILRPWLLSDAEALAEVADDPAVAANLRNAFPSPYTLEDAKEYIASCMESDGKSALLRCIEIDGAAAGSVGCFVQSDIYCKNAELGYWLAKKWWGRGIMTAAVRLVCAEAFETFDIARIYAEPFERNAGSRRVLENAGFTLEGTIKKGAYKSGEYLDWCMYGLLK